MLDIGVGGVFVEHYGTFLPRERFRLLFRWKAEDVEFLCEVRRTVVVRGSGDSAVSHTGARFVEAFGESEERLQDMMATFVGQVLAAQKMNASGDHASNSETMLVQLGAARRSRARGYLLYRYANGKWYREPTDSPHRELCQFCPAQPALCSWPPDRTLAERPEGETFSAPEDDGELD